MREDRCGEMLKPSTLITKPPKLTTAQAMARPSSEAKKPVIGVGGIFTADDAAVFFDAGATAVQAYNGFVRGPLAGPRFAFDLLDGLATRR